MVVWESLDNICVFNYWIALVWVTQFSDLFTGVQCVLMILLCCWQKVSGVGSCVLAEDQQQQPVSDWRYVHQQMQEQGYQYQKRLFKPMDFLPPHLTKCIISAKTTTCHTHKHCYHTNIFLSMHTYPHIRNLLRYAITGYTKQTHFCNNTYCLFLYLLRLICTLETNAV